MTLSEFYDEVARRADVAGTKNTVAETKRALAVAFEVLLSRDPAESADLVAKGLAAAKKKSAKVPAA